jgi:hypothetical protein
MNQLFKTLLVILLAMCWGSGLEAEKRIPPQVSLDDLSDPSSPSYVPNPYPKTNGEIIENLEYQISKMYSKDRWEYSLTKTKDLLPELIKENPGARIEEIAKVKNRISLMADNYSYLIIITDLKGKYVARVAMKANGLLVSGTDPSDEDPGTKLKKFHQVLKKMEKYFKKEEVKSIELMAFGLDFGSRTHPLFEITLENGTVYYYDHQGNGYLKASQKILNGKSQEERMMAVNMERRNLKRGERYIYDMLNDSFMILKKIK